MHRSFDRKQLELDPPCRTVRAGPIDPFSAREFQNLEIEAAEARAMVEMAEMRQLVAQGVDQAGVFQGETGFDVPQPDGNPAFRGAHAVAALHARRFGSDFQIREPKVPCEEAGMQAQLLDQRSVQGSG